MIPISRARPALRHVGALLLLALLVAACGGDNGADSSGAESEESSTTMAPAVSSTAAAAGAGIRAADGDTVRVHYTGRLEDGTVFDSSEGREPLEFVIASGQVIKGFDDAVRGLAVGETRTQRVEPADGYGESDPELIIEVNLDQLPAGTAAGDTLVSNTGQQVTVVSIDLDAATAIIDGNFFLAGKVLVFDVELVELTPAG